MILHHDQKDMFIASHRYREILGICSSGMWFNIRLNRLLRDFFSGVDEAEHHSAYNNQNDKSNQHEEPFGKRFRHVPHFLKL
jgi:hypothetical protein